MYDEFPTPAVVAELNTVERNIKRMVAANGAYGIAHRPHIKPHKSIELAKLQLALGAKGVTCAKLGEAEVMAKGGITDILVAYPLIGEDKLEHFRQLRKIADIKTIVNSVKGAEELSKLGVRTGNPVPVLIEVDGGCRRGGLEPGVPALDFARKIRDLPGIHIIGVMYYGGDIYGQRTVDGVIRMTEEERDDAVGTAKLLEANGFEMSVISTGSSFSAKHPEHLNGVTETRAGNYIFNDGAQLYSDMVTPEDCALRVVSTVVARPDSCHAIIDAGVKALTSDLACFGTGYGYIIGHPEIIIYKLNEEHGFLKSDEPINFEIGEKIAIIPNHACVVPNLVDEMYGLRDGKFDHMIRIDARGKNQ